jgi:hypothetical protein
MTIGISQVIIGALVVIGFFGSFAMLLYKPDVFTEVNKDALMLMIGALVAAFSGLMGFFFGSSAGSARKTDLLARSEPIIDLRDEAK